MTPTTITISGEGSELIERLRAGMKSRELIDLFGLKFVGVKLEAYPFDTQAHANLIAQEVAVVQPEQATDIDWSKKPEGFPIWIESLGGMAGSGWHRDDGDRWVDRTGSYWPKGADERGNCRVHLAPWSGDGLPPVETTVVLDDECFPVFDDYRAMIGVPVVVTAAFKSPTGVDMIACALPGGLCGCFRADMARPIKTPAKIAAEEREAAISEMLYRLACSEPTARQACEYLYDAGYRKGGDK